MKIPINKIFNNKNLIITLSLILLSTNMAWALTLDGITTQCLLEISTSSTKSIKILLSKILIYSQKINMEIIYNRKDKYEKNEINIYLDDKATHILNQEIYDKNGKFLERIDDTEIISSLTNKPIPIKDGTH